MSKLKSIIDCLVFCGKQIISLRANRGEDWRPGDDDSNVPDCNPGNLLKLLEFRQLAGDASIGRRFHSHGGGQEVLYTSPAIQNDLLACCADVVREQVLEDIRAASFFSVLADEAVNSSNQSKCPSLYNS